MNEYWIPAREGRGFPVEKGQTVTVIDVEGGQVADFFADLGNGEYLSPAVTIDCNESLRVGLGTVLYSNLYRPLFQVVYDDVQAHDLLFPSCSKAMYDHFYGNGADHPNCLDNLNAALGTRRTILQPVNLFMHTTVAPDGKITICPPLSKAGDRVVLRALESCMVGVSACSVSECDTNSGNCTPLLVRVDREHS